MEGFEVEGNTVREDGTKPKFKKNVTVLKMSIIKTMHLLIRRKSKSQESCCLH